MQIICMLAAFLSICAPQPEYDKAYSAAEANKSFAKMAACAEAVSKAPVSLDDKAKNHFYGKCLIQLGATI